MDALARYLAAHGVAARPLREAVALLTDRPYGLDELVRASALPRRTVEELLEALGTDLDADRIRPDRVPAYRDRIGYADLRATALADPLAARLAGAVDLVAEAQRLIAAAPGPLPSLDHVPATAETLVRRALWLDSRYDLAGAHLLCVGDHDLTSVLVALVNPTVTVTVVDLDERVLAYLDTVAAARGLALRCRYADLRFGLPGSVHGRADLVFTDPPYTPDGVRLFLARGLAGLRDREHGRLLLAYGHSDRHPALGWQVQQAVSGLGLVYEEIVPAFHRYHGAQAVGSAADLYVCRPTARSWSVVSGPSVAGIYTHGPRSAESVPEELEPATVEALRALAGPGSGYVGPGTRIRLDGLLASARTLPGAVALDLSADPGAWLLRTLLAVNAVRVAVLVPNRHPDLASQRAQEDLSNLLRAKYRLTFRRNTPDSRYAVLVANRVDPGPDPGTRLVRHLLDRAHGRLANVWRDGLVRIAGLAPAQARARVRVDPAATLLDLPRHRLAGLLAQATESATSTLPSMAAE